MALHGKGGNLVYGGANVANLRNYTLSRVGETAEVSAMGDTWAAFIQGLTDFNATAEGLSQKALDTTALMGASGAVIFSTAAGGAGYSSNVIVTGITETATVDDAITVSYTYEGNDAAGLVYGAATGTAPTASANTMHGKLIKGSYGDSPVVFSDLVGWSVTMTCPTADATVAHATTHGRLKVAGIPTATATVTILTPTTVLPIVEGTAVEDLILWRSQTAGDGAYEGDAICTGSETGVDATGVETTTMSFLFTGIVDLTVA